MGILRLPGHLEATNGLNGVGLELYSVHTIFLNMVLTRLANRLYCGIVGFTPEYHIGRVLLSGGLALGKVESCHHVLQEQRSRCLLLTLVDARLDKSPAQLCLPHQELCVVLVDLVRRCGAS